MSELSIENINFSAIPVSKKRALDLIDTVILPIAEKIRGNETLLRYFPDRESMSRHSINMGRLAVAMLFEPGLAEKLFERMHEAHAKHGIPLEVIEPFMTEFIQRYVAWVRMSTLVPEEERTRLEEEANAHLVRCQQVYAETLTAPAEADDDFMMFDEPSSEAEDGFAFFESEQVDEAISDMHTSTSGKAQVSAADYMASGELLPEQVDIIMDEFRELEDLFHRYVRFEPAFVQAFQQHLKYLADSLFGTIEFEQMGYSLQQLIRLLDAAGTLDESHQTLVFTLLEQLVLDLLEWARKLFVEQDAIDIHYLDAALLASIAQIEMMLGVSEPEV
ncbi:hypothetical protein [Sulfurivirga sp.]|uniref:hypothetical protein n=1 Tax=Sulfurivirga sp. TaxID=2614236 RepID=UPI0025E1F2D0|nr:hypothetical protein [Sulfurivirga sp.]